MSKKIKTIIALGFFDSVHIGHKDVVFKCVSESEKHGVTPSLFTFSGNLKSTLFGQDDKPIYSFNDRLKLISLLGINEIFSLPVNDEVLSMDKFEFLDILNEKYDIVGYVFGEDFSFGRNGEGRAFDVITYAESKGQKTFIVDIKKENGKKISTTQIKYLLKNGEIEKANSYLTFPYFLRGEVVKDRGVGKTLGFPTANVNIDNAVMTIYDGVYSGKGYVDGKSYPVLINYGYRPTFGESKKVVEVYFDGLNRDIYGKEIKVEFLTFLRNVKKFDSVDELKLQLKNDVEFLRRKND